MIDRLLLSISWDRLGGDAFEVIPSRYNKIMEISPDGEVHWVKPRTSKLRSDDPNVNLRFTAAGFQIWASPAVLQNNGNNVFGSSDIYFCAGLLIDNASIALQYKLPSPEYWELDGIDITHNYLMQDSNQVLNVIDYMKRLKCSRLKTDSYPESVYYGKGSKLRTGKAYSKGHQLRKLQRRLVKQEGFSLNLDTWQEAAAYNLLRLELCLKKGFLNRYRKLHLRGWTDLRPDVPLNQRVKRIEQRWEWWLMTEDELNVFYDEFWAEVLGNGLEIPEDDKGFEAAVFAAAASLGFSEGYANAAMLTWASIRAFGLETTRYRMGRAIWYRHLQILKAAGLTSADFEQGVVQTVRITHIELGARVENWDDVRLRMAA